MKKSKKILLSIILFILIPLLIYVTNITSMPTNIILFQGEQLNLRTAYGLKFDCTNNEDFDLSTILESNPTVPVSSDNDSSDYTGKIDLNLSLLR